MDLDAIELHDAKIALLDINYLDKSVLICIDFYESRDSKSRRSAKIVFRGVGSISMVCAMDRIADNANAGNVNYWTPAIAPGTTYIYLVDGCIAICSESLDFER